jgi:hypothetical protein
MTATINDVTLLGVAYQNVYTATAIVIGTPLIIQNKSSGPVYLQIATVAPSASDKDGFLVYPGKSVSIENATEGLFAFGKGRIHVAQDTV